LIDYMKTEHAKGHVLEPKTDGRIYYAQ
jgi:hypothetical protein